MKSQKIVKDSLADEVFYRLKGRILSGEWKAGEKIPSEQVISQMYGVSRLTARIAIERLNTLRICETRVGEGTYVQPFDFSAYIAEIDDLMLTDEGIIDDVNAYRTAIELCACEQIIRQKCAVDLDELEAYCVKMESLGVPIPVDFNDSDVIKRMEEYISLDYGFHALICSLSGNRLLTYSYQMAKSPIIQYLRLILKKRVKEYAQNHPTAEVTMFERLYDETLDQPLHRAIMVGLQEKNYAVIQRIHRQLHNYAKKLSDIND